MAPTMPTGTLAVTTPIRAEEIRPGDVITVRRSPESPPVTHRVIEVRVPTEPGEHPRGAVEFVLKGDDNDAPDSRPYFLTDARKVIFAVPRVGTWLMLAKSPVGSGVLILMAGALATWAFWPRGRE